MFLIMRATSLVVMLVLATTTVVMAGEVVTFNSVGGVFRVPLVSQKEMRTLTVVRQQYDFSCGAASLATLLTFHYGKPVSEFEVFNAMYTEGDREKIEKQGFSMLEMKRYLDNLGFHSDGFRLKLERLKSIGVPAISLIDVDGYKHFVVVKGLADGRVLIGDPVFGVVILDEAEFETIWSGTILAIRDNPQEAKKQFNKAEEWSVRPRAPVGRGFGRQQDLSSFTLHLPGQRVF